MIAHVPAVLLLGEMPSRDQERAARISVLLELGLQSWIDRFTSRLGLLDLLLKFRAFLEHRFFLRRQHLLRLDFARRLALLADVEVVFVLVREGLDAAAVRDVGLVEEDGAEEEQRVRREAVRVLLGVLDDVPDGGLHAAAHATDAR